MKLFSISIGWLFIRRDHSIFNAFQCKHFNMFTQQIENTRANKSKLRFAIAYMMISNAPSLVQFYVDDFFLFYEIHE